MYNFIYNTLLIDIRSFPLGLKTELDVQIILVLAAKYTFSVIFYVSFDLGRILTHKIKRTGHFSVRFYVI